MEPLAVAAGAAVLVGAAVQSSTGFGFSLVAAPLMFAAFEAEEAVAMLLALSVVVNTLTLGTERRRPRPLAREATIILAFALPGMVAGVAVLQSLSDAALQLAVSAGVLATLAARRMTPHRDSVPAGATPAVGLVAGVLTTTTTTSGLPIIVYLIGRGLPPARVRDTLTVCFLALGFMGATVLALAGSETSAPPWGSLAAMVPLAVAGQLAGRPVFRRLAHGSYERVVTVVLMVAVAAGLTTALL